MFAFRVRACRPERPQSTGTAIHHALFSAKHFCKFMRMHVKSQPDARKPRRTTQALDPTPLRLETPTSPPPPPAPPPQKNGTAWRAREKSKPKRDSMESTASRTISLLHCLGSCSRSYRTRSFVKFNEYGILLMRGLLTHKLCWVPFR